MIDQTKEQHDVEKKYSDQNQTSKEKTAKQADIPDEVIQPLR